MTRCEEGEGDAFRALRDRGLIRNYHGRIYQLAESEPTMSPVVKELLR